MSDITEQITNIQKEIRETPYHKGTEHHIGMLRARLARLKDKLIEEEGRKGSGGGVGYAVKKQGDATIVLVGPPSVGKSTLINLLTNANSKIAPYSFTTVSVIPGMMRYKNAHIQILDVPGLIEGAEEGKGRGKEVLSVIRGCDLILVISEPTKVSAYEKILFALERNGIRVNKEKPKVVIEKKTEGGIIVHSNIKQAYSKETVKQIAIEMGIKNAVVTINEKLELDRLIDSFSKNRVYIPAIFVLNKADLLEKGQTQRLKLDINGETLLISAEKKQGIEKLLEEVWKALSFINVYLVKKYENPSFNSPLIVKNGATLYDIAEKIGEGFAQKTDHAVIWGAGAKFEGQEVSLKTKAQDGMQIRFI